VATGTIVVLFTSWYIWSRREKLNLGYSLTESEIFPLHGKDGKYYAIKLTNSGKKLIKSITVDINLSDAEIDQVTSHDLIKDLKTEINRVRFNIDTLNPGEAISFIITAKISSTTTKEIKIRGEGVNAIEATQKPSTFDLSATATVFFTIGFFATIIYANVMKEDNPLDARLNNIYRALAKAETPHTFQEMLVFNSDPTYRGTAYNLSYKYASDPQNRSKYKKALLNLLDYEMLEPSKATIYYFLYKISLKENNTSIATTYLNKCKDSDLDTYKFYMEYDQSFQLDSTGVRK